MLEGFFVPLGLVFIAELGDKTQLVALTLATRFRPGIVLAGVLVATLVVHLLSVAIGGLSGTSCPPPGLNSSRAWPSSDLPSGPYGATNWMSKRG